MGCYRQGQQELNAQILSLAVYLVMLLEPICEEAFYDFSYGFRPERSAHQAVEAFRQQATRLGVRWVLVVDIRKYFDSVNRKRPLELVGTRIGDGVVLRLLSKWLHAGVMEAGQLHCDPAGTPQGSVLSPLLSNSYLHEVLDRWFAEVVPERMAGKVFAVRYADDLVIGFTHRNDAERVCRVIFQRFEKYGLQLHPEKTRLVPFARPETIGPDGAGPDEPAPQGDLCVSIRASRPFHLQRKTVTGGTVCANRARTGLWGSRWATTGSTRKPAPASQKTLVPVRDAGYDCGNVRCI